MIFENFRKSLKKLQNPLISTQADHPGWPVVARSGGTAGAREVVASARGGAAGVPEARNTLGMSFVVSLAVCTTIGVPRSIFGLGPKNVFFFQYFS